MPKTQAIWTPGRGCKSIYHCTKYLISEDGHLIVYSYKIVCQRLSSAAHLENPLASRLSGNKIAASILIQTYALPNSSAFLPRKQNIQFTSFVDYFEMPVRRTEWQFWKFNGLNLYLFFKGQHQFWKGLKTLWQIEHLLSMSKFSIPHHDFNSNLLMKCQIMWSKGFNTCSW